MRKNIVARVTLSAIAVVSTILITSCSSENVDESIRFAADGNIYMSQELCDAEDPDISAEMEKKLNAWWDDIMSGKTTGRVICED